MGEFGIKLLDYAIYSVELFVVNEWLIPIYRYNRYFSNKYNII